MSEELETITKIEEFTNLKISEKNRYNDSFSGYRVTTDKQEILIAISDLQSCCENWGYVVMNDPDEEFVGATIREITTTDTALNTKIAELGRTGDIGWLDHGDCMFVNIETDRGTLQFAVYNSHNGYYGHDVAIHSRQLNYEARI